ncbi:HEAT repeat domain-containing protein [Candidatus Pacearchaeota archaeon]|nr:HEAT repeat domain-containing protein [Candidatus Pacearchaeota archaeon]
MKVGHTCFGDIPPYRLREINRYRTNQITCLRFEDPKTWPLLADIMIYHKNPITRHEACFISVELGCPYASKLVQIVKYDRSIVVKHEAAEALGKIKDKDDAWMAYTFLRKAFLNNIDYDDGIYHPDVQASIRESIEDLEERFKDFRGTWQKKKIRRTNI